MRSSAVRAEPSDKGAEAGEDRFGEHLGYIENGNWAAYKYVDFGAGMGRFEARAASLTYGGAIEIRLDSPDGALIGTCAVGRTGGRQSWDSFSCGLERTTGVHAVYLVFKGLVGRLFNLESFTFGG